MFSGLINSLKSKSFPLNRIYLSKNRLLHNYSYLTSLNPQISVAPVLKSNAYGHGIELVGKILDHQPVPFLCVDSLYEAYLLQKAGVKSQILIMGYVDPRSLEGKKLPFAYAVFDYGQIKQIKQHQPEAKLHLFIDTGMHREGDDNLKELYRTIRWYKEEGFEFEGLMSHFAMPRKPDALLTKKQFSNFSAAKKMILQEGLKPKWFHIGGTYGLIKGLTKDCNVIRCGKGIYGFGSDQLKPVLSLSTTIIQWKKIKKGEVVGYDGTFTASRNTTLAVLPIGYNDGIDRRLSNKGTIRIRPLIKGLKYDIEQKGELFADCRVVGRVSMNLTTIDITEAAEKLGSYMPYMGAQIEIISNNPDSPNSVQNIAEICHTIPEEILVHLHPSTRREII